MQIGILGGTGPAGSGLGARLASIGYEVCLGSRQRDRAELAVAALQQRWPDRKLSLIAGDNNTAASADLVVLATPWEGCTPTAESVQKRLVGKNVVCMANALVKIGTEFQALLPPRGSIAVAVQSVLPGAKVVAAFQHLPAKELADLDNPIESDVLICSDYPDAAAAIAELVTKIPHLRPLDAGRLSSAAPIECFTAVLLQLNSRYKTRAAIRLTGINVDQHPIV